MSTSAADAGASHTSAAAGQRDSAIAASTDCAGPAGEPGVVVGRHCREATRPLERPRPGDPFSSAARHRRREKFRLLPCRLVIGHPTRSLISPPQEPGRGRFPRAIRACRAAGQLWCSRVRPLCLLLTACSGGPMDGLTPSGIYARRADNLFGKVFIIVVVVFVLVEERSSTSSSVPGASRQGRPVQIHGHTGPRPSGPSSGRDPRRGRDPTVKLIFDFAKAPRPQAASTSASRSPVVVQYVYAAKWPGSRYVRPADTVTTANELHIPVGKPVYLSQLDRCHPPRSGPQAQRKAGRRPRHTNHMTIEADAPGPTTASARVLRRSHANMRLRVIAETRATTTLVAAQKQPAAAPPPDTLAAQGPSSSSRAATTPASSPAGGPCATCHTIGGSPRQSASPAQSHPRLLPPGVRRRHAGHEPGEPSAVAHHPQKEKPGSVMPNLGLSNDEITALVAYLQTLR